MASTLTSADYFVDRRRLRRKLLAWRIAGFVLAALVVVGLALHFTKGRGAGTVVAHIARVKITGLITGDDKTIKLLRDVGDSAATGLILDIDSPGGTTVGSEKVYDAIRAVAAKKPVVAEVSTLAASGAYIAALGADHIVARGNSLVGSIGVLFEFPNVSKLLDTLGVDVEKIKSAPLKAEPDGFTPTSDAARAAIASLVADSYDWFKGLVKQRRAMTDEQLAAVVDGRVFTGRQSLPLKLIDQIGTETDAVAWLQTKGVAKGLPIRDWEPQTSRNPLRFFSAAANIAAALGATSVADVFRGFDLLERESHFDGLMSVWNGPAQG
jgi:protease IV